MKAISVGRALPVVAKQGSQCQLWDTCCNLLPKEAPEVPQTIKVTITASGSMPELDDKKDLSAEGSIATGEAAK